MSYHPNFKDEKGQLEQFAWPGGYLIEWMDDGGNSLCAECAMVAEEEEGLDVSPLTHEAGSDGYTCEGCGEYKK